MFNFKLFSIKLLVLGFLCTSFIINDEDDAGTTKTFTLKPQEEFIFGEFTFEKTKFKVYNSSNQELQIKILDQESKEPQYVEPFEPNTSFTARLYPWEKILIQNPNDNNVNIVVKSNKLNSGFRIQEIQIHTR
ncbi:MAG: hypothetical protein WDZ35_08445 [Crocinitomicaceae bacterium]